jgi:hypothetical protein
MRPRPRYCALPFSAAMQNGRGKTMIKSLFEGIVECPRCHGAEFMHSENLETCKRCGYAATLDDRFVALLPDHLSDNNAREAAVFSNNDIAVENYTMLKPFNYPRMVQENYLKCTNMMAKMARKFKRPPSVLCVFAGGGMEPHLSGLLGDNVVLADISLPLLKTAAKRFEHYKVPQAGAYFACDAERLPFKNESFDLVIGFAFYYTLLLTNEKHESDDQRQGLGRFPKVVLSCLAELVRFADCFCRSGGVNSW